MKSRWVFCVTASCLVMSCSSGGPTAWDADAGQDPARDDVAAEDVRVEDVAGEDVASDVVADDPVTDACEGDDCVAPPTGCCTVEGVGCCEGTDDCCEDDAATDACRVRDPNRNGSEVCDDSIQVTLDPVANRYFLLCLNDHGGTAYVSTNSGGPCGDPFIERCQCWEETGVAPWGELDYVAQLVCDRTAKRLEVDLPEAGRYHFGVHSVPGEYNLAGYCPLGDGCMTCVALLEIPR